MVVLTIWIPSFGAAGEERASTADDLLIVDCLLPAKVRRLGRRNTFLAPRQPIRTTAVDCRIRGGEYTEPDQATYATALQVWLPLAEGGDVEAQFHLGQIFERGLGLAPDYESAAAWYQRAAEQEHGPSQVSLGHLYEEGLGVEADEVAALNWYRRAAGLAESLVVLEAAEYSALTRAREELETTTDEADALRKEVEDLRQLLDESEARTEEDGERRARLEAVAKRLESQLAQREVDIRESRVQILSLEKSLEAMDQPALPAAASSPRGDLEFGSYHALVIGNADYATLPDITTAETDARDVAEVLTTKYGFKVELLLNATRYQIMTALNGLRERLTEEDNLLVYYAGHGRMDGEQAYWQPIDAEEGNPANWIPSEVVTEHLDLVPAKHLFLVADSVYSGLRTRSAIAQLPVGMTDEQRFFHIKLLLDKRSRLVLTSGDEQPQPAAAPEGHSRFSTAFLEVLEGNDGILEASRVYQQLAGNLSGDTEGSRPEFAPMRWARNNVADFFFVAGNSQ